MTTTIIHDVDELQSVNRKLPIDISPLVSLSRTNPDVLLEDGILNILVELVLDNSPQNTLSYLVKLNVMRILAQVAKSASESTKCKLQVFLGGISEWFDDYVKSLEFDDEGVPLDRSLHESMVLFLARLFDYELKTEDVLELTNNHRSCALLVVITLIEGLECFEKQRDYELPLALQLCRLLRGFTIPNSYFSQSSNNTEGSNNISSPNKEISAYNVTEFSSVINGLLSVTMSGQLLEKLTDLVRHVLYADSEPTATSTAQRSGVKLLDGDEHAAVIAINNFVQNLFLFGEGPLVSSFQRHLLGGTSLIKRLVLPYLESCVLEARLLDSHPSSSPQKSPRLPLTPPKKTHTDNSPSPLAQGVSYSIRTLIMATFRAPRQVAQEVLINLNPTNSLLRSAPMLLCKHPELLALLCLLNVNMNTMDASSSGEETTSNSDVSRRHSEEVDEVYEVDPTLLVGYRAHALIRDVTFAFSNLSQSGQSTVYTYLVSDKHGLPVSRDLPSYQALLSALQQETSQLSSREPRASRMSRGAKADSDSDSDNDIGRAEAKSAVKDRIQKYKSQSAVSSPPPRDTSNGLTTHPQVAEPMPSTPPTTSVEFKHAATKQSDGSSQDSSFRLLGELPSLSKPRTQPLDLTMPVTKKNAFSLTPSLPHDKPDAPCHLCCAINGHVMKDPVRSPSGHTFEFSTITLWLQTHGMVCPCTGVPLVEDDLVHDTALRIEIMRWQINRHSLANELVEDQGDLYEF